MALQLKKDLNHLVLNRYDSFGHIGLTKESFDSLNYFIGIYETLRRGLFKLDKESISMIYPVSFLQKEKELFADSTLSQLKIYLEQMVTYLEVKGEALPERLERLEKELSNAKRENKALAESLDKFIQAEDFKVEEEKLRAFPEECQSFLHEALGTYKNGFYVACCSMCGNIFAGLVKDVCQRNSLEFKGLSQGINALKDSGIVKEPYEQLIEVAKYYRDHADHPTSEAFTKEKAKLFLSSLIIFIEEIFP